MSCDSSRDQTVFFPFALTSPCFALSPATHRAPVCWNRNRQEDSTKGKKQYWRVHGERRGHAQEKAERVKKKIADHPSKNNPASALCFCCSSSRGPLALSPRSVLSVCAKSLLHLGKGEGDTGASVPEWEFWSPVSLQRVRGRDKV